LNGKEQAFVKTWMKKLLVEISKGEYALAKITPSKKNNFGNWTKHWLCEDYELDNK